MVGCGIRIHYAGTELNRGGTVVLYRPKSNNQFPTPLAVNTILLAQEAVVAATKRKTEAVVWAPSDPQDLQYGTFAAEGGNKMLILVTGAVPGVVFNWECVAYFEGISMSRGTYTPSHSDPVGMGAVTSALPVYRPSESPTSNQREVLSAATSNLMESASGVVSDFARTALNKTIETGLGAILGPAGSMLGKGMMSANYGFLNGPSAAETTQRMLLPSRVRVEEVD
jgi:hypothetical protein